MTQATLKISFLVLFCFVNLSTINAQTNQPKYAPSDSPESPITCEDWLVYLGTTLQEWEKHWKKNNDASLIVIARLGDKESRRINLVRIKTLKEYILAPRWKVKAVFAEGERIKGFGVIELCLDIIQSQADYKKGDLGILLER